MNKKTHSQGVFILVLYLMFAIFTLALTLTASSVYENISTGMEENHSVRTALSYISTKMRQADGITVEKGCLTIAETGGISRIYYHNGAVMEHYGEADMEFEADYGDEILSADSFAVSEEDGTFHVEIGMDGEIYPLIFAKNR